MKYHEFSREKTSYKYVHKVIVTLNKHGKFPEKITKFRAYVSKTIFGFYYLDYFDTLKEAAIAVDKIMLKQGKEPVNILKRKI